MSRNSLDRGSDGLSFRLLMSFLALAAGLALACLSRPDGVLAQKEGPPPRVVQITIKGAINPVTAGYIRENIAFAEETGADLLILQLDTPGGLVSSTRDIVKDIWASTVPVAVHVWPPGGHAASAGTFITMAGHIAAMAPGTNMGAAHPVNVGGGSPFGRDEKKEEKKEGGEPGSGDGQEKTADEETGKEPKPAEGDDAVMAAKVLNDTVAFIRSIAERNGRNADWAEKAVRESVTITGEEAVRLNVIDVVAENTPELLEKIEGRKVTVAGEEVTLSVTGAEVVARHMNWRYQILATISDPNIAYILMMLGIYGVFFELANPGVILPGVLGGIFLILAFFSFQVLSINYAGVLLILLGLILFILEVKVISFGMLTVGGVISIFLGSIMLFDTAEPYYRLSLWLVGGITLFTALFFVVGLGLAIRAQRRRPTTGVEGMVNEVGFATTDVSLQGGRVRVHGEIWNVTSPVPISAGTRVKVTSVEGMKLIVEPEDEAG